MFDYCFEAARRAPAQRVQLRRRRQARRGPQASPAGLPESATMAPQRARRAVIESFPPARVQQLFSLLVVRPSESQQLPTSHRITASFGVPLEE